MSAKKKDIDSKKKRKRVVVESESDDDDSDEDLEEVCALETIYMKLKKTRRIIIRVNQNLYKSKICSMIVCNISE